MARYHINPKTGNPAGCHAQADNCPFGGDNQHFETKWEAMKAYEEGMIEKTMPIPSSVRPFKISIVNNGIKVFRNKRRILMQTPDEQDLIRGVFQTTSDARMAENIISTGGVSTQELINRFASFATRRSTFRGIISTPGLPEQRIDGAANPEDLISDIRDSIRDYRNPETTSKERQTVIDFWRANGIDNQFHAALRVAEIEKVFRASYLPIISTNKFHYNQGENNFSAKASELSDLNDLVAGDDEFTFVYTVTGQTVRMKLMEIKRDGENELQYWGYAHANPPASSFGDFRLYIFND